MTRFGAGMVRGTAARALAVMAVATAAAGAQIPSGSSAQAPATHASTGAMTAARAAQLDDLLGRLKGANDEREASQLEDRIFEIWSRSGDAQADSLFNQGLAALAYRDYARAQELFTGATQRVPEFVEAWNKLASVRYLQGDFSQAMRDADHTLLLERRHYGALAGRGLVLVALGDERGALTSFEMALAVNPASANIKKNVERLRDRLGYRIAE